MTTAYQTLILAESSLASYWELDDAVAAATAADSKGSTTLTATGVTFGATPVVSAGTAASLDGSTSTLINSSASPAGALADTTLEAWVKWTVGATIEQTIFRNGKGNNAWSLLVNGNGTTTHHLYILNEGVAWHDTGYILDGGLHHLVVTVAAGPAFKLYVDGGLVYSATLSSNTPAGGFSLGCSGDSTRKFQGTIDEAAVYSSALSASAIATHYEAGGSVAWGSSRRPALSKPTRLAIKPRWSQGLLAAHAMAGYGTTARDAQGNRYPATLVSGTAWGRGEYGDELTFSGTNTQMPVTGLKVGGLSEFTVAVLARADTLDAGTSQVYRYLSAQGTASVDYRLVYETDVQQAQFTVGSATVAAQAPYVRRYCLYVGRFNAGAMDLFLNGLLAATGSSGPATVPANDTKIYIGSEGVSGTGPLLWNGGITAHYVWSRALSDLDVKALAADPFAPVRPGKVSAGVLAQGAGVIGNRRRRLLLCGGG